MWRKVGLVSGMKQHDLCFRVAHPDWSQIPKNKNSSFYEKIRISEITNAKRPIDSARPAPTYAYFDILLSASGLREIPLNNEEKTLPIAKAAPRRPKAIKPIAINLSSML